MLLVSGRLDHGVDQVFVHLLVVRLQHIWDGDGFSSFRLFLLFLVCCLIKDTPESKGESKGSFKFDFTGLIIFDYHMLALNLFITRGGDFGWTSPLTLICAAVTIIGVVIFY